MSSPYTLLNLMERIRAERLINTYKITEIVQEGILESKIRSILRSE